jgi:hypothetical protein
MPALRASVGNRVFYSYAAAQQESVMKFRWIMVAVAIAGVIAAEPALARAKHKAQRQCVDRTHQFSWNFLLPGAPSPVPNGCSPPVFAYGKFIGQDPDPNIRHQLLRDPATGYSAHVN